MKKKYPDWKEDNINFYLQELSRYVRISLGVVTKQQLNQARYLEEVDRAYLVSRKIDKQLQEAKTLHLKRRRASRDESEESVKEKAKSQRSLIKEEIKKLKRNSSI